MSRKQEVTTSQSDGNTRVGIQGRNTRVGIQGRNTRVGIMFFLYPMVAHFTMRTCEVSQEFRFAGGIWLQGKNRQVRNFVLK